MNILSFIQKNKLLVHYITIIVIIIGIAVLLKMQREARPNVNFNRVAVRVAYPGAAPSDIEELVIDPIEEKLAEVDGVEEFRSVSFVGAGSISIKIDDSYPNPTEIVDEIRRKISEVKDLPKEVGDPAVTELKATNIPVLNLALYGDLDAFNFKMETEKLKDFLQLQDGVQSVSYTGIADLQLKVRATPSKLDQFDITLDEIFKKLSSWAKQRPGGLYESKKSVTNLTIGEDLNSLDSLNEFIIRSNDSGKVVKLKDVAHINFDLESIQIGSVFEDKDAVLFTVVKKPFEDSIKVVDNLKLALKKYREGLPSSLNIKLYRDQSIRIRNKLKIVIFNALTGLVLVLIILLIFLDWRSSFVTAIGIPIAILGGLIVLYFMGHTINSLVVVGIIIVLGMLVDDAIVVSENIYTYVEKGMTAKDAAFKGTMQIARPVIASVLTTIFAFFPIVFMKEIIGQFLRVIPIAIIAMLAVSLIEALLILPIHAEEVMRPKTHKKNHFFHSLEKRYEKYLRWSIEKRWYIIFFLFFFTIISLIQGKKIFDRFSLFPAEGLEGAQVRIELPKNTILHKTKMHVKQLSKRLIDVSEGSFDNIYSNLGSVNTGGFSGSRQNGAHLAMIRITFTSDPGFIKKEKKILKNIKDVVASYEKETGVKASVSIDRPGPPIGRPIQFQITSRDFEFGHSIVEKIKTQLKKIKGVQALETDLDGDSKKFRLKINNEDAVSEGIDPTAISRTIFSSSTGVVVNEILKNNEKVEILLALNEFNGDNLEKILALNIRNKHGQAIPLSNFVSLVQEKGPSSIQRLNGLRTITLFGDVDEKIITGKEANAKIKPFINELKEKYQTITIKTGGGEKDRLNALKDTMRLYVLAIILIFMVISLTFQSTIYPFLVLTAIPMGLSGVIWSLVLHGKSLSIMGIIGVVGLSGVVVNVSILYLKLFQDFLREEISFENAIIEAGKSRFRPIIMTTFSTLLGLIPTIYGIGGIDIFVQSIALVLGWGLFVATLLTLTCLPAILSFFTILKRS